MSRGDAHGAPASEERPALSEVARWRSLESVLTMVLFLALCIVTVVPLFSLDFIPGVDTSTHLSMLRILKLGLDDPVTFHASYGTRLAQPYWGYYAPVLVLATILPLELSARIVLAAVVLLLPVGVFLLARREGAPAAVAFLSFPFVYSIMFYLGFYPFMAGAHLALLGLIPVLSYSETGLRSPLALLTVVSLAVFVSHAAAWPFWALPAAWILVTGPRRLSRKALLGLTPAFAVPPILLAAYDASLDVWGNLEWIRQNPADHSLWVKTVGWFRNLIQAPTLRESVGLEWILLAIFLLPLAGRFGRSDVRRLLRWSVLSFAMFLGYWILPQDVGGVSFFYHRFLAFGFVFLLLCAPRRPFLGATAFVPAVVFAAFLVFHHGQMFGGVNAEMEGLRACLSVAKPRTNLIGLMAIRDPQAVYQPVFLHADNYHTYWNWGRVYAHSMDMLPTTPVYYRAPYPWDRVRAAFDWRPTRFNYRRMAAHTQYILIHGPEWVTPARWNLDQILLKDGYPFCRLVCRHGFWRLYENTLATPPPP